MKAIVLAGGGGTRLWPLSTEERPKQFLSVITGKPMIIETIDRLKHFCMDRDIVIVTNKRYEQLTLDILKEHAHPEVHVIAEPDRKNTAPAIVLAVRYCREYLHTGETEPILVFPSDHVIEPLGQFEQSLTNCVEQIQKDKIVTLGVVPTHPSTEYGYIKSKNEIGRVSDAEQFKEKPDLATAQAYLDEKRYYWNAGIYGFHFATLQNELKYTCPELANVLHCPYAEILSQYPEIQSVSIDYAVSEKSKNIAVVPLTAVWNDIGDFDSLYQYLSKQPDGNVVLGNCETKSCHNTMIINMQSSNDRCFKAQELENLFVIFTDNGVLLKKGCK